MKTPSTQSYLWLLLALALFHAGCRKKAPEGFSADFEVNFNNGGMAPDQITLRAQFADADSYDWSVEGVTFSGQQTTFTATTAGSFYVTLEVESGQHKKTKSTNVAIENYPTNGEAMTVVQGDGVIGTFGVDGANPFFVPIDTIASGGIAGMDYDDETRELYYTGSIIRAFPNGVGKTVIFSNGDNITDLVVDGSHDRIYYGFVNSGGEFPPGGIASIDQDGNDLSYLVQETFFSPLDITLDAASTIIYFTLVADDGCIFKSPGDDGPYTCMYFDNNEKYALVFDNSSGYLYYAENFFDRSGTFTNIMRFNPKNYNPNSPETWPQMVVENASTQPIYGLDILESKQQLYWSDTEQNVIYRKDLNNPQAEPEIIFTGATNPRAIAISNFH